MDLLPFRREFGMLVRGGRKRSLCVVYLEVPIYFYFFPLPVVKDSAESDRR